MSCQPGPFLVRADSFILLLLLVVVTVLLYLYFWLYLDWFAGHLVKPAIELLASCSTTSGEEMIRYIQR